VLGTRLHAAADADAEAMRNERLESVGIAHPCENIHGANASSMPRAVCVRLRDASNTTEFGFVQHAVDVHARSADCTIFCVAIEIFMNVRLNANCNLQEENIFPCTLARQDFS